MQYGAALIPHSAFQLATQFLEPYARIRCIQILRSIRDDGLDAQGATLFDLPAHTHDLTVILKRYEELAEAYRNERDTFPNSKPLRDAEPTFQCVLWLHACIARVNADGLREEL